MSKQSKIILSIIIVILIVAGAFLVLISETREVSETRESLEPLESYEVSQTREENEQINNEERIIRKEKKKKILKPKTEIEIPASIDLDVPFTCQAPHQNWDMPWQEACEEAALMMIHHYFKEDYGNLEMPKDQANNEILEMVSWQEENWGGHYDLTANEIAKLAREYYGYKNVEVRYDMTIEDIKKEVGQGNPVLVPSAGRMLANPHFTPPGPIYHNLVIVGYDEQGFITNDPGVWQGHKFRYSFENLYDSIHDFVQGTSKVNPSLILQGRRVMVVVKI